MTPGLNVPCTASFSEPPATLACPRAYGDVQPVSTAPMSSAAPQNGRPFAAAASTSRFAFAQSAKYTAKIGHLEAPTQPRHRGLEKVAALVKERTKGEVEFKLFPASQLGNARQMIEGTQFGSMESTVMPAAFLGGFNPVVSVFDIPFLLPNDMAKANALRTGAFGQFVLDSFTSRGLTAIAL